MRDARLQCKIIKRCCLPTGQANKSPKLGKTNSKLKDGITSEMVAVGNELSSVLKSQKASPSTRSVWAEKSRREVKPRGGDAGKKPG
jgi:hypothetical protein